jgi:hypothetical protein
MSRKGKPPSAPGFRFWWWDAFTIVACALVTWLGWRAVGRLILVLPVTLVHFFLFCNIFRVGRRYELVWTGLYLLNIAGWVFLQELNWVGVLALQTPVTIGVVVLELRSRLIYWRRINPKLGGSSGDPGPGRERTRPMVSSCGFDGRV